MAHSSNHDRRVFSGEIVSSARLHIAPVKLEKGEVLRLSANRRAIVFIFTNHGYIDGVNFTTDCATSLTVKDLHVGSHNQARTEVYLGATKAHPRAIPFTVHRRPTTTT